ncbi:MAG: phospholipid carrier-dependent glycosyltransferase [Chloroflexota bacterium]|nr:phospholipid carrier-dependent glycosyltransferase [Chloroflexota bacterium]MDQ5865445.1 phospholipid carrier-dependent glycosyltransferase [Chloroflexota bacterium]
MVPYIAGALILYGVIGVAIHLRLFSLLTTGVGAWFGLPSSAGAPASLDFLAPLHAHFDGTPWLPWASWLLGVGLLTFRIPPLTSGTREDHAATGTSPRRWLVPALVLMALLLLAGFGRMVLLLPQDVGLSERPYDDEGVYAGASQLFLQGIMPYRDYFFAHPPVAAFSYAPAMAYHYNEWGSPTSFMMARYLSVGYSLITLALLFLVGTRLAGLAGGTVAGLLWALDGRVVEINRKVMLDGPMVLLSCAALLLYLWARPYLAGEANAPRRRTALWLLVLCGILGALSTLTKIAGVACLLAILTDMAWMWATYRFSSRKGEDTRRVAAGLLCALGGAVAGALTVLLPFLVLAPSHLVRDVFFFQLLRPNDGIAEIPARIADLTATLRNPATMLLAALGLVVLSAWVWVRRSTGGWWVVAIWMFFSVLLFTYSRSFYQHYYIQLAAPLCLLGAGVSLLPGLLRRVASGVRDSRVKPLRIAAPALLAAVLLPLLVVQWTGIVTRYEERIFEVVGRYVNDAVPPGTSVLATDEQFNLLAARPPSHNSTGYLVDSYGHMISLGIGLNTRDIGDLWSSVLSGRRNEPATPGERPDVYGVMYRPAPQADFLDRVSRAPLVVLHGTGRNRLTEETQGEIAQRKQLVVEQSNYWIYRDVTPR